MYAMDIVFLLLPSHLIHILLSIFYSSLIDIHCYYLYYSIKLINSFLLSSSVYQYLKQEFSTILLMQLWIQMCFFLKNCRLLILISLAILKMAIRYIDTCFIIPYPCLFWLNSLLCIVFQSLPSLKNIAFWLNNL